MASLFPVVQEIGNKDEIRRLRNMYPTIDDASVPTGKRRSSMKEDSALWIGFAMLGNYIMPCLIVYYWENMTSETGCLPIGKNQKKVKIAW